MDETTEQATPEQNYDVKQLLHEREIFHFQNVVNERLAADGIDDPAEKAELEKAFHERIATKKASTAAQWVAAFEDVRAERKAAKNAPPPPIPWMSLSDEEFDAKEKELRANARAAIDSDKKTKQESFSKATEKLINGDDESKPDWLGMSDEEFEARDKKRAEIARKRMIATSR